MPDEMPPDMAPVENAPLTGPQALRRAIVKPARSQLVVGLLLALLGFAGVTQVRSAQVNDQYAGLREQDLIDLLTGLSGAGQRAEGEISRLEQVRRDLLDATSRQQAAVEQAESELDSYAVLAGTVPVQGPGITVTIVVPDLESVPAEVMLDLIQELRTAGAEAIEINGSIRVVASTSIVGDSVGLIIDGERISAPYELKAIGDAATLTGGLVFPDGPVRQLEILAGAQVKISPSETVFINAIAKST